MAVSGSAAGHDGLCGSRHRRGEGLCRQRAGWGTPHPGSGSCKLHGGCTTNHLTAASAAEAREAVKTYGLSREVDPRDALLEEVHRSAEHVAWLADLVADLEHGGTGYRREEWFDGEGEDAEVRHVYVPLSGLKQLSTDGKYEKPSVWVELYQRERKHLREVCRDAINAGIAERAVSLAEQQGTMLVGVIRAILSDLHLSAEQAATVAEVVPRHLRAVSAAPGAVA